MTTDSPQHQSPELATGPSRRPERYYLLCAIILIIAAVIAIRFDTSTSGFFAELAPKGTALYRVFKLPNWFFKWYTYAFLVFAAIYQSNWKPRLIGLLWATVGCAVGVHGLKFIFGRARPEIAAGVWEFTWFGNPAHQFDSFPSGHSTQAWLLALILVRYWPKVGFLFLPAATLVSLSRVVQVRHYLSDALAGAALACVLMWMLTRWLDREAFARWRWVGTVHSLQ